MNNVKLVQYKNDHWYAVEVADNDIRYFASVTTKQGIENKPFLSHWRGSIGNREADYRMFEAQTRGSRIHSAWEGMQLGKEIIYDPNGYYHIEDECIVLTSQDEMMAAHKLQQAFEIIKPEILHVECTVYSMEHRYAGTVDSIWRIKEGYYDVAGSKPLFLHEGIYIVDLKTGKSIGQPAYEQTAAYAVAAMEMGLVDKVIGTMILHTEATTRRGIEGFTVGMKENYIEDFNKYKLINDLYDLRHEGEGPKIAKFPSRIKLEGINP